MVMDEIGLPEQSPFHPFLRAKMSDVQHYEAIPLEDARRLLELDLAPNHNAAMGLLLGCGLRISEVCNVKREDYYPATDQEPATLILRETKNYKTRRISLSAWVATRIETALSSHGSETIIGMKTKALFKMFLRAQNKARFTKRYTPHCCRVTAITQLLDQGFSHREVMRFSGHSSVKLVERYDRMREEIKLNPGLQLKY
jgi:integrase/recombinase XerD